MKNKKIISMILLASVTGTTLVALPTDSAYANEISYEKTITTEKENKEIDLDSIIKDIENNYLRQNSNGTFYILDAAYEKIDADVINFLKGNMNEINSLIISDQLEFEMKTVNSETEIINTANNIDISNLATNTNSKGNATTGKILSNYSYCSNYVWYWWGYTTNVNKKGTELLLNQLEYEALVYGAGCGLAALIPGGGAIAAAIAAFGGTITYGTAIKNCKNGIVTGKGVKVVGVGKPSSGNVLKLSTIY